MSVSSAGLSTAVDPVRIARVELAAVDPGAAVRVVDAA